MKLPTRYFIVMRQHPRYSDESTVCDWGYKTLNDAHEDARHLASKNPGIKYVIFEAVGYHEAQVLPASFTSLGDPPMLLLAPGESMSSEDLLK